MSTHLQKPGSDVNAWGLVHNDYHKTLLGGYEYIGIQYNVNKPPTIKQYSRFSVYKTDSSYTIPNGTATGNNNYPMNTTPTYNLSQAIFEDGADVTFDWSAATRGETCPAQSDGVWYIYCKNSLDTDATTKGQGVYNVSKTETPTFSVLKGGWYSANGYRVIGQFTSATNVVSALYLYRFGSPVNRGSYNSKGVYSDATNIYIYPYEIEVNGVVYFSTATTTIRAWSGLAASATWYAAVMKESDGVISIVALGSGWDTYAISGNQLNLLSIYDPGYGYCRAARTAVFYRILAVFKSNATPNAATYIFNIENRPRSAFFGTSTNGQSIANNSFQVVDWETISYDINSNVSGTTTSWIFTSMVAAKYAVSFYNVFASSAGWAAGELQAAIIYVNNVAAQSVYRNFMQATINPYIAFAFGSGTVSVPADGTITIKTYQNSGGAIVLETAAGQNLINIIEV